MRWLFLKVLSYLYQDKSTFELYDLWKNTKGIHKRYPVFIAFEEMVRRKGLGYY